VFPPQCERPRFTPMQNNKQNYSTAHFNILMCGQQSGRRKILDRKLFLTAMYIVYSPVPGTTRSKAWVCGHLIAGVLVSNPAGSMDVCLM
jgi:hypothetical protein